MTQFQVTRAQLKNACEARNWDLLDRLLEIDKTHINDAALFTDDWGEWWGMLLNCVLRGQVNGVHVLLKHGADTSVGSWGDCIPTTPEEAAKHPAIVALLTGKVEATYTRKTEPELPRLETIDDAAVNRQGAVRDATGLVFSADAFREASSAKDE